MTKEKENKLVMAKLNEVCEQTIPLTAKEFRLKLMAIYHSDKKN
jgi:hypothetical protein